jgi:hypothetical protein
MTLKIYATNTITIEELSVESKKSTSKLEYVVAVIALDSELTRALKITGLPQYGTVMSFHGDMAKHIVGNWFN